ncbi:tetratricopeptide repeat protein [uncultured Hymenobacter sp.]|uniref:tetratricopeptide repeat protein n=1 Tax=uncultured Hymenobacter sp. TaxID=170016 RepID=UPI0035CBEA02
MVLAVALALVGALFVLPKGIVKPKEGKAELSSDAAKTANRDGGGPNTNGSKAEASSGPVPANATDNNGLGSEGGNPNGPATAAAPHTSASPAQRSEISGLLAKFAAERNATTRAALAATLAARYERVERFDSAGYYYEQVAASSPNASNLQRAADAYYQAFSFAATEERVKLLGGKARDLYGKVLKANPGNLDAKTNLGMTYMASENPVKGVGLLREVLAADPRNEKALYNLGILSVQSNQFDKAVERFKELVKVNPNNVNGQFYLGVVSARTGDKEQARQAFTKAKSLSNDPALAASVAEELAKLK